MESLSPSEVTALLRAIPIGAPTLELWFNGVYGCLTAFMCWIIITREKGLVRKLSWLAAVLTMYTFATIHAVMGMVFLLRSFANHAGSPAIITAFSHPPRWYSATGIAALLIVVFTADCIYIWRCWVVWGKRWSVVVLPIMCLITGYTLAIIGGIVQTDIGAVPTKADLKLAHLTATYYVLETALTLYLTIFITARIVMVQIQFPGAASRRRFAVRYSRAVEIIVEGCVLYSALFLTNVVFSARSDPRTAWPVSVMPQLGGIIPTLLLFRVAMGMTRPDSSYSSPGFQSSVVFHAPHTGGTSAGTGEPAVPGTHTRVEREEPFLSIGSVQLHSDGDDSSGTLGRDEEKSGGYPV